MNSWLLGGKKTVCKTLPRVPIRILSWTQPLLVQPEQISKKNGSLFIPGTGKNQPTKVQLMYKLGTTWSSRFVTSSWCYQQDKEGFWLSLAFCWLSLTHFSRNRFITKASRQRYQLSMLSRSTGNKAVLDFILDCVTNRRKGCYRWLSPSSSLLDGTTSQTFSVRQREIIII